jgi:hypothetical protein
MIGSTQDQDFRMVDGPYHVLDQDEGPIVAHYAVRFTTTLGEGFERFLTDKGRAEMLRLIDRGQRMFSRTQLDDLTVPPSLEPLMSRIVAEGGEGG